MTRPRVTTRQWAKLAVAVLAVMALAATAASAVDPPPYVDAPNSSSVNPHGWFQGGLQWTGDLNDPHVVRVGSTYYAYSSPTGGRYLPVVTSTDLTHWYIHPGWSTNGPPGRPGYSVGSDPAIPAEIRSSGDNDVDKYNNNDALVVPAWWGLNDPQGRWLNRDLWAPGVMQIGANWYAYSAVRVSATTPGEPDPHGYGRFCLTVAVSTAGPLGPFRDSSGSGPIQCQPISVDPAGSIDPYPYHDPSTNQDFLLWKAAGKVSAPGVQGHESSLMSVQLGADGKPLPGAPWVKLLETDRRAPWQGGTVENPAMVQYQGVTYLFFAANDSVYTDDYGNSAYAEGYAICPSGPRGACYQPQAALNAPLLSSSAGQNGQAGGNAFVDTAGNLRLSYAYYWAGEVRSEFPFGVPGRHPRRMAITQLARNSDNTLSVQTLTTGSVATKRFVTAAYTDFLGRAPSAQELDSNSALIDGGNRTTAQFVNGLATSTEWATSIVNQLYTNTLGRSGDPGGVAYWSQQISSGARSVAVVAASFYASDEYYRGIGGATDTSWVTDLYRKLLQREPDQGGLGYWVGQVPVTGRPSVALRFFQSSESAHTRVGNLYLKLLGRPADAAGADYWAQRVVTDGDIALAVNLAASSEYFQRSQSRFA